MATATESVQEVCRAAKGAARALASLESSVKNAALSAIATALETSTREILDANAQDVAAATRGRSLGRADRPPHARPPADRGDGERRTARSPRWRIRSARCIDGSGRPDGLTIRKVRVPLGVVAVVYEARPNVTIDAAALCLKSGNAVVLRGSSSAAHSNAVLSAIAARAAESAGVPPGAISNLSGGGRDELAELATQDRDVDLIIPRGGEGLKAAPRRATRPSRSSTRLPATATSTSTPQPTSSRRARIIDEREGAAPRRVQRRRDAARASRRRRRVPAGALSQRCATAGVELRGDERARARRRGRDRAGERRRLGRPSTWR